MKRDRLFGNVLMRLAAYVTVVYVCAGSAWCANTAPINPRFMDWQRKREKEIAQRRIGETNESSRLPKRRLLSASGTEEGAPHVLGYIPDMVDYSYLKDINFQGASKTGVLAAETLPSSFDLRTANRVTSIKDQRPYGTCWAHATYASLESWLLSQGEGIFDFSEKHLAAMHGRDWGYDYGGNATVAAAYLTRWSGPIAESEDPYPTGAWTDSPKGTPLGHVQNIRILTPMSTGYDTEEIKRVLYEVGAVYVSYTHISAALSSDKKNFYWNGDTSIYNPDYDGGHAVTIIGWDDNYSKNNFKYTPPYNGAFLVKNSWGANWGDNGCFWVSYWDVTFGASELFCFNSLEPTDNYGDIYQYDPLGKVNSYGGKATMHGANVFVARKNDLLAAVGFYANAPNTKYTISIYVGCAASSPVSGTLGLTQSGTVENCGYVTIPLDDDVSISKGQRFSIVFRLNTPGYNYPLAFEAYYSYSSNGKTYWTPTSEATASAGESFISNDGTTWTDFTTEYPNGNLCFKAYTKSATATKPTLLSISIRPEDGKTASIKPGNSAQMRCEANYSNNSSSNVTDAVQWSLVSGRNYATLSASGFLIAKDVAVLEPQVVTVQAIYSEDGITATNRYGFSLAATAPEAPINVTASQGTETSCIRINWTASAGATKYAVYRATVNNSGNAQYLDTALVPKYFDNGDKKPIVPGVDYWYFIKAGNNTGEDGALQFSKEYSSSAVGWRKLSPPEVTASDDLLDKVSVTWNNVEGATHYRVYRAESMDGEKTPISGWIAASTQDDATFDDTTATAGVTYFYFVVAAVDASGNRPSDYSLFDDGIRPEPVTIDHLEIKGDASIAAGGFADYATDAIYTDGHKVENITPDSWEIVGEGASVVGGRVSAANVTENKAVVLKATYADGSKTARGEKQITIAAVKPVAPRNVVATATAQAITLTWNAVAGTASYVIYRDGSVVGRVVPNAPDAPATAYTDNTAVPGVTYAYCVAAANGAGEGPQSSPAVTATVPLPVPTGVTATIDRTDGVLVDWRRVMDNAPYQSGGYYFRVARATSDNGAKTELGTWTTATSFLDTTAAAETAYWYFVRAATSSSGANASDWSASVVGRVVHNAPQLLAISITGPDRVASSGSAVYSCTAAYDDGMVASIAPSWSASGAAAIDANGKLTAHAVTADADVTVTAAFGGKSATKDVKVLAPVQASASVSNVRVKPRWPFSTLVDIDYTLSTAPEGTRALVTLSGQDNDHDVPLAAKTLTGDAVGAAVAAGEHRLTWDIGADYPRFHAASFDVKLEAVPYTIAAPANVAASQGTSTRGVNLSWNAVEDATGYEIWRARGSMNTADAVLVTNVEAVVAYEDTAVNPGDIYFYWFKTVTQYGTGDFSASVFGYRARVVGTVAFDANGGTASASSLGYTAGNPYGSLPTASRTGYEFDGWFTAATGGSEVTAATPADENIATLYAHWTPHTYTIHFDANGGTGTMADIEMTYDVAKALPSNTFVKAGFVFVGWSTNLDDTVVYENGTQVTNLATAAASVAFYATWADLTVKNVTVAWNSYPELTWDPVPGATSYYIWRNGEPIMATTGTGRTDFSPIHKPTQHWTAYSYQVQAVCGDSVGELSSAVSRSVNLMPLRNVLNVMDHITGDVDGYISEAEMNKCLVNPHAMDLDGNNSVISSAEMAVFTRIQTLNNDKELIHRVIQGDYTYEPITYSVMYGLQNLSDTIKELTKNRNN